MFFSSKSRNKLFELDNANVNVVPFANRYLFALTETSMLIKLDPKNLNVLDRNNVYKHMKPTITSIAHPHILEDGSWISIGMRPMTINITYDIMSYSAKNSSNIFDNATLIAQIPSSHKFGLSYFHSFGLSQNYIIFLEQSLVLDIKKVLWSQIINKPTATAINMNPNFHTRIHLVNRKSGQILQKKFYTDPQISFHHINAYEINEDDESKHELLIDVCSYKTFNINIFNYDENDEEQISKFNDHARPVPRRIRVPLYRKEAEVEKYYCEIKDISDMFMDLPAINYDKFNAKPYNYAYGFGAIKPPHSIVKINVNNYNDCKQAVINSENTVTWPSEPVFVEKPGAKEEDDGVILTLVLGDKYDFLIVLDAKTLEEIGRAELPENVKATYTFHGFFTDNKAFS